MNAKARRALTAASAVLAAGAPVATTSSAQAAELVSPNRAVWLERLIAAADAPVPTRRPARRTRLAPHRRKHQIIASSSERVQTGKPRSTLETQGQRTSVR